MHNIISYLTGGQSSALSKISKPAHESVRMSYELDRFILYLRQWIAKPYNPRYPWADDRYLFFAFYPPQHERLLNVTIDKHNGDDDRLTIEFTSHLHPGPEKVVKKEISKSDPAAVRQWLSTIAAIYRYSKGRLFRSSPTKIRQRAGPMTLQDRQFLDTLYKKLPWQQVRRLLRGLSPPCHPPTAGVREPV